MDEFLGTLPIVPDAVFQTGVPPESNAFSKIAN